MEDTRYSAKEVDNGQNAGTDRDNVRGVGDAERGAHGGRQGAVFEEELDKIVQEEFVETKLASEAAAQRS